MKAMVAIGEPLNADERNLFSLAFKNIAGNLRSSYRTIDSIEQKMIATTPEDKKKDTIELYREKIQAEMDDLCKDVAVGIGRVENDLMMDPPNNAPFRSSSTPT